MQSNQAVHWVFHQPHSTSNCYQPHKEDTPEDKKHWFDQGPFTQNTFACIHVPKHPSLHRSSLLEVILFDFLMLRKSSLPSGVKMLRIPVPLFTGTQVEQTTAKKAAKFSMSEDRIKWIPSLSSHCRRWPGRPFFLSKKGLPGHLLTFCNTHNYIIYYIIENTSLDVCFYLCC